MSYLKLAGIWSVDVGEAGSEVNSLYYDFDIKKLVPATHSGV